MLEPRRAEVAFAEVQIAERHRHERGERHRSPEERGCGLEVSVLLLAREPLEHEQRADDADRQMEDENVETAEKIEKVHLPDILP